MKRNKKSQHRSTKTSVEATKNHEHLEILTYEITYDVLPTKEDQYPKEVKRQIVELHDLITSNPNQAIPRLNKLKEGYPHVPILYNYLAVAYSRLNDQDATRTITIENYQNNPSYLFAKINYAQVCLLDCHPEKIPEIFDNKYDLKLLYPDRTVCPILSNILIYNSTIFLNDPNIRSMFHRIVPP